MSRIELGVWRLSQKPGGGFVVEAHGWAELARDQEGYFFFPEGPVAIQVSLEWTQPQVAPAPALVQDTEGRITPGAAFEIEFFPGTRPGVDKSVSQE